jgi:signal peptide peptidase SppA
MPDRFPHVRRALYERPWAMDPAAFEAMVEIIERRISGVRMSRDEIDAALEPSAARRQTKAVAAPGAIAVLSLRGVIAHRAASVEDISGPPGTSTERFGEAFDAAVADPNITSILIDVDSPGGEVFGVQELGEKIFAARGSKPIEAIANAYAASAAYWLGTQADSLSMTPSGQVGSVGVIMAHDDVSAAAEKAGVKRTYITAGKFKAEGNQFAPLDEEAVEHYGTQVREYYDTFVSAVSRGRKTSLKDVRENYGEGRVLTASIALQRGMVDRVETFEAAIARLSAGQQKAAPGRSRAEAAAARLRLAGGAG